MNPSSRKLSRRLMHQQLSRSQRKIRTIPQKNPLQNICSRFNIGVQSRTVLFKLCTNQSTSSPSHHHQKIRTFVSTLKAKVPDEIASRVVYQITCPSCHACYVGQTDRHTCTRYGEHKTRKSEPVRKHFEPCAKRLASFSDMTILHRTTKSIAFLETLEALYIRKIKPTLNTWDEWRSRELTIHLWVINMVVLETFSLSTDNL